MVRCFKLTYCIKLLTMEIHRYPKQCYVVFKISDEVGKITRASHVKDMLYKYGFVYVWTEQDVSNCKQLLGLFTQRQKVRIEGCN